MKHSYTRRHLFKGAALTAGAAGLPIPSPAAAPGGKKFRISLAEWSFHRAIRCRLMTNLDFPRIAREQFGIEGLEFVNGLWAAPTQSYLQQLKHNIKDTGTHPVLIMCDGEGSMGNSDRAVRMKAAYNHHKWVDAAAELGCFAIRANMRPGGKEPETPAEINAFIGYCAESFRHLCEYAAKAGLDVIVENHGGASSHPAVMVRLMKEVNLPNFGTLPDFGNFPKDVNRYDAVRRMMPYAKDVSFKCHDFAPAPALRETTMDMDRLMKIVLDAGYHHWVGIEFEGKQMTEFEGVQAAKRYLDHLLAA